MITQLPAAKPRMYAPQVRARIYTSNGTLDVTNADLLHCSISNAINQPTGQWDMLLTGRSSGGRTFADRIQPMDYVEISMSRVPSAGGMGVTMRGFVDNVRETWDGETRRVSVNGRNFGKVLLQTQIYYMMEIDPVAALIPQARLEINYNIPGGVLTPRQFVNLVYTNIIAPNIANYQQRPGPIPGMQVVVDVPDRYAVNGFAVQPFSGSVWNLLDQYASKPWCELFTRDTAAGPELVFRVAPYRDITGAPLGGYAGSPITHTLSHDDVESISIGVSDNEVYTYYFTYPVHSLLDRVAFKAEGIDLGSNPYVDAGKMDAGYGFRPLELSTTLIPSLAGDSADLGADLTPETMDIAADLNRWLVAANQDNDRLRNGTLAVKGGGTIQPGDYVSLPALGLCFYVSGFQSSYDASGGSFRTSLQVVRGYST